MSYSTIPLLLHRNETNVETNTSRDRWINKKTDQMVNDTLGHPGCFTIKFSEFVPRDNPGNVISSEVEDLVHELKDVVFLPILFLIGGPANGINMAVFYKQGLKERINVCLFALSLADGLYLVNSMLMYGEQLYFRFTTKET